MASDRTDYVNLWFRLEWFRLIAWIIGVVGTLGVIILWAVFHGLFGDVVAIDFLTGVFIALIIAIPVFGGLAVWRTARALSTPPQSPVNVSLKDPGVFVRGPVRRIDGGAKL